MTTIYISGPMRAKPDHNYPMFLAAEKAIQYFDEYFCEAEDDDLIIHNPARNFNGDKSLDPTTYMRQDLKQVLDSDALVLLPDWEMSEYGKREVEVAKGAGLKFYSAEVLDGEIDNPTQWCFDVMDEPTPQASQRGKILATANSLINGDRNSAYGAPYDDFSRTAAMWNGYGATGPGGRPFRAHDVGILLILMKTSRLAHMPGHMDSYTDIAGYAGCSGECAVIEQNNGGTNA